jgi:hypothetical protein
LSDEALRKSVSKEESTQELTVQKPRMRGRKNSIVISLLLEYKTNYLMQSISCSTQDCRKIQSSIYWVLHPVMVTTQYPSQQALLHTRVNCSMSLMKIVINFTQNASLNKAI